MNRLVEPGPSTIRPPFASATASSVLVAVVTLDIWRQRDVTDPVDDGLDRSAIGGTEPDCPATVKVPLEHFAVEGAVAKNDARAWRELLSGVHQGLPGLFRR